jgi:activating signal cointegrator complex subunit 3
LSFGIGLHHAGLVESDRKIVENLFFNQKILILIATATLAWGVNFPAHLVIIKGTEYRDPKTCQYVDMPITDVLQMIGRAGRPQYDNEAIACLFVKQDKKNFYKKFLYEPFPLESSLHKMLYDHINAEISSGMLTDKKQCVDYIKWTYFFKRLVKNPTYYGLSDAKDPKKLNEFINKLIEQVLKELHDSGCIKFLDNEGLESTYLGNYTSFYYMSYKTAKFFNDTLKANLTIEELINVLTLSEELSHVPVRHTEDEINKQMAQELPIKNPKFNYGKAATKGNLLIQAHFCRMEMPISDYRTDLKSVLDNCIRILLFMADICKEKNILDTLLNILNFIQMIMQGLWMDDCSLMCLPGINLDDCKKIIKYGKIEHLCEFCEYIKKLSSDKNIDEKILSNKIKDFITKTCHINSLSIDELNKLVEVSMKLPILDITYKLFALDQNTGDRIYDQPITENSDVQLSVTLTKYNDTKNNLVVYSRYPKIKNCRWFIILGNVKTNEVLAFEKVAFKEKRNCKITFTAPKNIDEDSIKLYIMSDSYFGLDQEYNVNLKKINKGIMDKFGIIEIKQKKEIKDEDIKENNEDNEDKFDEETQKGDDEDEEDLYLENW